MQAIAVTWRRLSRQILTKRKSGLIRKVVNVAFSDKYLLFTNVTISLTLSSLGDMIEQHYEIYTKDIDKFNKVRTMHMAVSGCTVGVLCHYWYIFLDKHIIGKSFKMVLKKLALDQFLFSPVMLLTFFATLALFEKNPVENFKNEVRHKFALLYRAEWLVWPPAQIVNFYFLPTRFRVLYDNTISLGYDVYTSHVKNKYNPHKELLQSVTDIQENH